MSGRSGSLPRSMVPYSWSPQQHQLRRQRSPQIKTSTMSFSSSTQHRHLRRQASSMSTHSGSRPRNMVPCTQSSQHQQVRRQRPQSEKAPRMSSGGYPRSTVPCSNSSQHQLPRIERPQSDISAGRTEIMSIPRTMVPYSRSSHHPSQDSRSLQHQQIRRQQSRSRHSQHSQSSQHSRKHHSQYSRSSQHHVVRRQIPQSRSLLRHPMWKARIQIPNHTQKRNGGFRKYPVACNKCRKPFKGSIFFCKCNCLFCEGVFPLQWCI